MSRKSDNGSAKATKSPDVILSELRVQIEKYDDQILEMINERAKLAAQIGKIKLEQGAEVFVPAREEEVITRLVGRNKGPLPETTIRAIYREIISGSRALQKTLKVAFLGPEYSFSHLAAIERFGQTVEFAQVASISAVFEEVARRHVDYGIVPLENSTDGRIADTLEMFIRMPQLKICGEVRLRVHHNLLANCTQPEIRRVYSKPQALSQCRNWLSKNLPNASLHPVNSTADAARLVQMEPTCAAVASRQAAVRYGIKILFADIEDHTNNETRFAVIGPQDAGKTGHDKTAIMFKVAHSPGSLVDALSLFKQNKINLTWIESFPARSDKPEYIFFVDFEGHTEDRKVKTTLNALQAQCEMLTILGSFPAATLAED